MLTDPLCRVMAIDDHYPREVVSNSPRGYGPKGPKISGAENIVTGSVSSSPNVHRNFYYTKKVGNYLIGKTLGEGSFAKVREGLHAVTGEKVAVKVVNKQKAMKDSYMTKNLRREGQIQQMIHHPNIVQLLDVFETESSYYLVMELCSGGSIMDQLNEKKWMEEAEVRKYIQQLVVAVEHLHRAGVVHRDLKGENILLDENHNIKLTDFGLSNCAGMLGYMDPFSTQCGSPAYAAPELLSQKKYGPKVDVWSIGVNMYVMLTGTLPFTVEPFSFKSLLKKIVEKDMNPLPPHLSPAAVSLLKSLLEPDPAKRPDIYQVMSDPWLHLGSPHSDSYPNMVFLEAINHAVVFRMTEQLGYQYTEVMNAVLSNRACHKLATYFLLDKKEKRLTKLHQGKQHTEIPWRKLATKIAASAKQTPAVTPASRDLSADNKARKGPHMTATSASERVSISCVLSCSPRPIKCQETVPLENGSSHQVAPQVPAPSETAGHSRNAAFKEPCKPLPAPRTKNVSSDPPAPRQPSAFQPYKRYLKKDLAPSLLTPVDPPDSSSGSRTEEDIPKPRVWLPFMSQVNILKCRRPPFHFTRGSPTRLKLPACQPMNLLQKELGTLFAVRTRR